MPTMYICRHGQANSAGAGAPQANGQTSTQSMEALYDQLTDIGHHQATLLRDELLRRLGQPNGEADHTEVTVPPLLVRGPLNRHRDTMAPLAEALGISETIDNRWIEFDSDTVLKPYFRQHPAHAKELNELYASARGEGKTTDPEARKRDLKAAHRLMGQALDAALQDWTTTPEFHDFRSAVLAGFVDLAHRAQQQDIVVLTSGGVLSVLLSEMLYPHADQQRKAQAFGQFIGRTYTTSITTFRTLDAESFNLADVLVSTTGFASPEHAEEGVPVRLTSYNEHSHLITAQGRYLHLR